MGERCYRIIRQFFDRDIQSRTVKTGLTLEEAQAHCNDPDTSSRTCTSSAAKARTRRFGPWFDSYDLMRGIPQGTKR